MPLSIFIFHIAGINIHVDCNSYIMYTHLNFPRETKPVPCNKPTNPRIQGSTSFVAS